MKLTVIFICNDYEYGEPRDDLADALEQFSKEMRLWTGSDAANTKLMHKEFDTFELLAMIEEYDG